MGLSQFLIRLQEGVIALRQLPADYPEAFAWYTLILRFVFPLLALAMLVRIIPHQSLSQAGGMGLPLAAQRGQRASDPLGEHPGPGGQLRCGT